MLLGPLVISIIVMMFLISNMIYNYDNFGETDIGTGLGTLNIILIIIHIPYMIVMTVSLIKELGLVY